MLGATRGRRAARPRGAGGRAWPATSRPRCSVRPASSPGLGKNTYGTGSFVLLNAGSTAPPPRARAAHHGRLGDRRARDLRARGGDLRHRRRGAVAARRARRSSSAAAETEALAASLDGNDGVYFVPALTGLGSPHWDPYARGTIVGLTRGSAGRTWRAPTLEAIAYQTVDAVRAMEARRAPSRCASCKADGGATVNALADAVPGRRARRAGGRARDRRDDRARRGLPGRRGRGPVDARPGRVELARARALRAARWRPTSATRCWRTGAGRVERAASWARSRNDAAATG